MHSIALLIGFILMFSFPAGKITVLPCLGFALILFFVLRMEKMEPIFKKAKIVLIVALPISVALLGLQIYDTVASKAVWFDAVYFAVRMACEVCELVSMVFIYIGVKIIGTNADVPSLEKQASRNLTVMAVYFISEIVMSALRFFAPSLFTGFEFVLIYPFIFGYLWHALNIWMAYTLLIKVSVTKH